MESRRLVPIYTRLRNARAAIEQAAENLGYVASGVEEELRRQPMPIDLSTFPPSLSAWQSVDQQARAINAKYLDLLRRMRNLEGTMLHLMAREESGA